MTAQPGHYASLWEAIADRIPASPALRHGERGETWAEFERRAALVAGALRAHGIGQGDAVAAYLYNCPEYFEVFFGALKIRAVPANVNYRYGSDELRALLEGAEAKSLFFDSALRDQVRSATAHMTDLRLVIEIGNECIAPTIKGARPYEELLIEAEPAPREERAEGDAFLSYTGGTTGLPKGVLIEIGRSLKNSLGFRDRFLECTTALDPVEFAVEQAEHGTPMRAIPASPLMHSTGLIFASLPTLSAGGTVTTLERRSFDAHELLAAVDSSGAHVAAIVGDAFALPIVRALDAGPPHGGRYDARSLRVLCSAGVAWSAHIKERLLEHLPDVTLIDSCGASEGVAYGTSTVRHGDPVATASFEAAPGLKVLSPGGAELPQGEVGMLAGPTTASGYHHAPAPTAATFMRFGGVQYAVPGDLGRIESDGTVTLIGRGIATINTGGEKVYPEEVEHAIKARPGVDDCLVLGVPDERFGQAVAALVVRDPTRAIEAADIAETVRASLAGYKVPRHVRFVDEVPRVPNGKVDHDAAVALIEESRWMPSKS